MIERTNSREAARFVTWVAENAEALRDGSVRYGDHTVNEETEVRYFEAVLSFIAFSFRWGGGLHFGHESQFGDALARSFLTLTFGWWGFPWGLYWTPVVIVRNLTGGRVIRVRDVLDRVLGRAEDNRVIVELTEAGAELAEREIARRGFPRHAAICIARSTNAEHPFAIQYDLPEPDPRDFVSVQHDVMMLVDKRIADDADGYVLDEEEGEFVFRPPERAIR